MAHIVDAQRRAVTKSLTPRRARTVPLTTEDEIMKKTTVRVLAGTALFGALGLLLGVAPSDYAFAGAALASRRLPARR